MTDSGRLRLVPLTKARLEPFRDLLGGSDFGGCFCAVWTHFDERWQERCADPAQPNYEATASTLAEGRRPGYLAYRGDELLAWTGAGPKTEFPLLATRRGSRRTRFVDGIWAIGCIAVAGRARGAGLSERIIGATLDLAHGLGFREVEAYPTDPFHEPRSYRGCATTYLRLGFREVARERDGPVDALVVRHSS